MPQALASSSEDLAFVVICSTDSHRLTRVGVQCVHRAISIWHKCRIWHMPHISSMVRTLDVFLRNLPAAVLILTEYLQVPTRICNINTLKYVMLSIM